MFASRFSMFGAAWLGVSTSAGAAVIAQWNFNDAQANGGGTLTPNIGAGTATAIGGVTSTFGSAANNGGSSDPAAASMDDAWVTSSYASQGTGSGTRGVQFNVSTAGYRNLTIDFDQRMSDTASMWWRFEYSIDGVNFTDVGMAGGGLYSLTGSGWLNSITAVLKPAGQKPEVPGTADNRLFAFRMTAVFAPFTQTYLPASPSANYNPIGNARWDMVTINGELIPGPGLPCILGLAGLGRSRRRAA